MRLNGNNNMPYMKSLATCLSKMVKDGYTEGFQITEKGLESIQKHNSYKPEQIQMINSFRFEGESDGDENAILYVIETSDGTKGTLLNAHGIYNDPEVLKFMKEVETIKKKT